LRDRSNRLSGAFRALGLALGDRVGTLAWNTQHHLETYYATMSAGFVCHTLNPRFSVAHLAAIVNEAGDRVLAVASSLVPLLRELAPLCPTVEHVVLLDGGLTALPSIEGMEARLWCHDALLAAHGVPVAWGEFDEQRRRAFATPREPRARRAACSTHIGPTTCTRCGRCRPMRSRSPPGTSS
jgi:fatty-acyl-CoA synthase